MGLFDDLVPANTAPPVAPATGTGLFDDLVPSQTPTVARTSQASQDPGLFSDLVPSPSATSPGDGNVLTSQPVGIGERFVSNARSAFQGTLLGSATNYLASRLAPNEVDDPAAPTILDPNTGVVVANTPRARYQQSVIAQNTQDANLPGYAAENGPANPGTAPTVTQEGDVVQPSQFVTPTQIVQGGAALAGSLVGGMASPESLVAGPDGYEAVRAGEAALPAIARSAGVQAGVQGTANAGAQGLNIAAGTQDEFSPTEVAQAAGTGALIGAVHPAVGAIVNDVRGVRLPDVEVRPEPDATTPTSPPADVPAAPVPQAGAGLFDDLVPKDNAPAPAETTGAAEPAVVPPAPETTPAAVAPAPEEPNIPAPPPGVADTGSSGAPGFKREGQEAAPAETAPVAREPAAGAPLPAEPAAPVPEETPAAPAPEWRAQHPDVPQDIFRGSGREDKASAYNGTAVPLLGNGKYSAFDAKDAAEFGPTVDQGKLDLANPLVVKSDEQWRALTKEAGWPVPNPSGMLPAEVEAMTARLKALVQSKGHDGIVVHWDNALPGDINPKTGGGIKTLRNVFDIPQVVDYRPREPAPVVPPTEHAPAEAALNDQALAPGATRAPFGGVRPERDFNTEGTSPYRQVFRDAGHDPDAVVNKPLPVQNKIIADQLKSKFGFKDVVSDKSQHPKEVRDHLSSFYQNAQEMTDALGMPSKAIGLDGNLTFNTKPFRKNANVLGSYAPGSKTITIPGTSNSFAHEWTHALDHHLSDKLANNPRAMKLLSQTKDVSDGTMGGRPVLPGSSSDAFVNVIKGLFGQDAKTAAEALKLQYEARGTDVNKGLAAQLRLDNIETNYAKGAKSIDGPKGYWAKPAELLARAHEAYVSEMIRRNGGDTGSVVKPYYDSAAKGDLFDKLYPQQGEKDHIFQTFTDLHDALRREQIMGTDAIGKRPDGLDIVDPSKWHLMVDQPQQGGITGVLKREVQAQKNFRAQVWDRLGYNESAADPGRLGIKTRAADTARALTYSIRGIGNAVTARQPAGLGREAFQNLMDRIAPAEHLRDAAHAQGRYIGPVFEESVRESARPKINQVGNILLQHGLDWNDLTSTQRMLRDVGTEKLMLRHVLTEGDAHNFVPENSKTGAAVPIPDKIVQAGGKLRYLLDKEWDANTKAGIDVGYARSGYFPRQYDDTKIYGDAAGFKTAAEKLHGVMFDQDVGDDPAKLLAAHDRLPKDVTSGLDPDVQDGVTALRANLKAQDKLRDGVEAGTATPADTAKLTQLQTEAADLHDQLHDPVRDLYAETAAHDWFNRINTGDPNSYDTRGPNASYTAKRVLPPEADTIMRNYMVNDPTVALPRYFQQSARKVAFADRFGKNGAYIEQMMKQATAGGVRGEDIRTMRGLIEAVTGRQKSGLPPPVERFTNTIHALGSIALMPRAAWSSLAEPAAMLARTGNIKATYGAFANQLGDIARTAGSKERAQLANALGVTISHLHDSVITDRTDANYSDQPGLSKLMTNFYRRNLLTQLTNSQRRSVMASGHQVLGSLATDIQSGVTRKVRDAAADLRDLGIPDAKHADFAKWMGSNPGLPSLADLDTPGGRIWGGAVTRLTDKIIQDPMRVDKPLLSQSPIGRLAYGLMSFNYSFYHNVVEHAVDTNTARVGEAYRDARDAGSNKLVSAVKSAPAAGRAVGQIGAGAAAIYAGALASTAVREALFNPTKWQEQSDAGTLTDWLSDLAFQRTGFNGPLDPVAQAVTGLKYERDLSALMSGAQVGYFLQAAGDILKPLSGAGSPDTNTSSYNAIKGAWNLFGVPAAAIAMTVLPGGKLASGAYGAGLQGFTSQGMGDAVATALAGPKGTAADGTPPTPPKPVDPNAPAKGTGSGLLGGVPIGALDDIAVPASKVAVPLFQRLPRVGKIAAGVAAGVAGVSSLADALSYRPKGQE